MKPENKAFFSREGGKIASDLIRLVMLRPRKPSTATESEEKASLGEELTITPQEPASPPTMTSEGEGKPPAEGAVATACVVCAVNHFSTSAGLLNEAVRFKAEGITSNEIADRIAKILEEQNTLERVDLTQEKMRGLPKWERELAEEALEQSRSLRHRLETLTTIEELEQAAADTEGYYRNLNREWWKQRLAKPELTLDEAKKLAADEATKEVERRWTSPHKE